MSDSRSAWLFGLMFEHLADKDACKTDIAHALWKESRDYDFSNYDLECDDALIRLQLAKRCSVCGRISYKDWTSDAFVGHDCGDTREI